ncbi:RHS repeat protein [Pseudomonas luteola]|uniref:RHS repeat protein n=1 Tax=Pseudomonas luteola TaxID=47886 RepID=UPI00388D4BFD
MAAAIKSKKSKIYRNLLLVFLSNLILSLILNSQTWAQTAPRDNPASTSIYEDPGIQKNRAFSNTSQTDTVDPFTGSLKIISPDLNIPGNGGMDINVIRNYQSISKEQGPYSNGYNSATPYGVGWDIHFGRIWVNDRVKSSDSLSGCRTGFNLTRYNPILELPDGSRQVMADADSAEYSFISKNRWIAKCLPTSAGKLNGGLIVYSPQGLKYTFDYLGVYSLDRESQSYFVSRIEDPNGNRLDFTYSKLNTLYDLLISISATDSGKSQPSRTVNFNYNTTQEPNAKFPTPVLSSITGGGKTISYEYSQVKYNTLVGPANYLISVRQPDTPKWQYSYLTQGALLSQAGTYSLISMTSPTGLKTSYTYTWEDMGPAGLQLDTQVVSSRTLSGLVGSTEPVQKWTYSYIHGFNASSIKVDIEGYSENDVTMERGPSNCIRYEHIGHDTLYDGYSKVPKPTTGLWKIGLLVKKEILSKDCKTNYRTEIMTWGSQVLSAQNDWARDSKVYDEDFHAPIITKKEIVQDGRSYVTSFTNYDIYGQPGSITESGQKQRTVNLTYSYPSNNWMLGKVKNTEILGAGSIANSYDNKGNKVSIEHFGVATKFSYDVNGNLISITDANNKTTLYEDYEFGVPRKITYADGSVVTREVNERGRITNETDQLKRQTLYEYDGMDRVIHITPPTGNPINISYTFDGITTKKTITQGNRILTEVYNQLGQKFQEIQSSTNLPSIFRQIINSADGKPIFISNFDYKETSDNGEHFTYDPLGRLTEETHADGSNIKYIYQTDNKVLTLSETGKETRKEFTAFGDPDSKILTGIYQPEGIETLATLDNLGRITSIRQGDLKRSLSYDDKGFLKYEENPETGITSYTYDNVGNIISKSVANSPPDKFFYDSLNRLIKIIYGGSTLQKTNTWDSFGHLISQDFDNTSLKYEYDKNDNLISETLVLAKQNKSYTLKYKFNAQGTLTNIIYPSGLNLDYSPDSYGRPTKLSEFARNLNFYPSGMLSSLIYGNGRTLTIKQDPFRLYPLSRNVLGADTPLSLEYTYDKTGNVIQISNDQNALYNQTMVYDGLNRLIKVDSPWGASSFTYNSKGDIISQKERDVITSYKYDSSGRMIELTGTNIVHVNYDVKGNIISARGSYGYDAAGNMAWECTPARINCQSLPDTSFSYDANMRRIITKNNKGNESFFFYAKNGLLVLEEEVLSGAIKEYIYLGRELIASQNTCSDKDTDEDTIPDCYEMLHSLDPNDPSDARKDRDNDGISNLREYQLGTFISNSDTDNDGMPDGWELGFGLDPKNPNDAYGDLDGDGITNFESYLSGKPPVAIWPRIQPSINYLILSK